MAADYSQQRAWKVIKLLEKISAIPKQDFLSIKGRHASLQHEAPTLASEVLAFSDVAYSDVASSDVRTPWH
jgi:hypothetical protein